ncbi:MAG: hypothetical protein EA409_06370 [Saprospirales bacterium]|nr:MAG: hypothetical protein EA409_06370 [Saprospirales bacterium]
MFGKLKKWLGVEGVKLELEAPTEVRSEDEKITGRLHFYSMNPQKVTSVQLVFLERYRRGRGKDKLIDEYELGRIEMQCDIEIEPEVPASVDFEMPFKAIKSRMDEFEKQNFLAKGVAKVAKLAKNVKSIYRLEARATVKGTVLHPIAKKEVSVIL